MFVTKNKLEDKLPKEALDNPFAGEKRYNYEKDRKIAFIFLALIMIIAAGAAIFLFISKSFSQPKAGEEPDSGKNNNQSGYLPGQTGTSSQNGFADGNGLNGVKAELIGFGDYYKPPEATELAKYEGYELPLDLKNKVTNYFYITRKFNLDEYIEELDQDGFAVIDNAFFAEANDFYSLYRLLAKKEIPSVVTTDFIFYYFQNELKSIYQEIEKNVFYDNIWKVYEELYKVALARYMDRLSEFGIANDTLLEAQRQEVAYLAVMLHILKPTEEQISRQAGLLDINKFNENEAYEYNFSMPDELRPDVEAEIELLRKADKTAKSPVFLRLADYSSYQVPPHYKANAKLNNFYLAIKWLQLPWPLYYKSEDCPDCQLDYRDWLINMAAAAYLSNDLGYDQELKNKWAIIYKFVSYFTGLEKDLTYLDYIGAYQEGFGQDYDVGGIFADDNKDRPAQADKIQDILAKISLESLHGGKKRDQSEYKLIGMRLLQDFYWPNDYLLNELAGQDFTADKAVLPLSLSVVCPLGSTQSVYRCRGSGFDIINILHDYGQMPAKYAYNGNFSNYQDKINELKGDFSRFNLHEWHENIYWTTLHLIGQYLDHDNNFSPAYSRREEWQGRDLDTALGAWANLHVPEDALSYKADQALGAFDADPGCDRLNIIEPRPDLISAMTSKSDMLIDILAALGVTKDTSVAAIQLKEMNNTLLNLKKIMLKVQKKEALDGEDCKVLKNFSSQYQVTSKIDKSFAIDFGVGRRLNVSNNGNKIMLLVYEAQGEIVIGFGPVFNYNESK